MTVKIVTDSSADLPPALIKELNITVVPLYVRFGDAVYRDRVDITEEEFYQRLVRDPVHPSTIQPSPQDFAAVYDKFCKEGHTVVSIHISNKLSGTCNSALQAREKLDKSCQVEVIDSEQLSMGLGLNVIEAATLAQKGASVTDIVERVKQTIPRINILGLLDTLKFLLIGGRIGKAKALLGSILNVKPILTIKGGEVMPVGQVRSRAKGIEKLVEFASAGKKIQDLAVAYNTTPDEAKTLQERLCSIYKGPIRLSKIGPMLGVHMGPNVLIVAYREG